MHLEVQRLQQGMLWALGTPTGVLGAAAAAVAVSMAAPALARASTASVLYFEKPVLHTNCSCIVVWLSYDQAKHNWCVHRVCAPTAAAAVGAYPILKVL